MKNDIKNDKTGRRDLQKSAPRRGRGYNNSNYSLTPEQMRAQIDAITQSEDDEPHVAQRPFRLDPKAVPFVSSLRASTSRQPTGCHYKTVTSSRDPAFVKAFEGHRNFSSPQKLTVSMGSNEAPTSSSQGSPTPRPTNSVRGPRQSWALPGRLGTERLTPTRSVHQKRKTSDRDDSEDGAEDERRDSHQEQGNHRIIQSAVKSKPNRPSESAGRDVAMNKSSKTTNTAIHATESSLFCEDSSLTKPKTKRPQNSPNAELPRKSLQNAHTGLLSVSGGIADNSLSETPLKPSSDRHSNKNLSHATRQTVDLTAPVTSNAPNGPATQGRAIDESFNSMPRFQMPSTTKIQPWNDKATDRSHDSNSRPKQQMLSRSFSRGFQQPSESVEGHHRPANEVGKQDTSRVAEACIANLERLSQSRQNGSKESADESMHTLTKSWSELMQFQADLHRGWKFFDEHTNPGLQHHLMVARRDASLPQDHISAKIKYSVAILRVRMDAMKLAAYDIDRTLYHLTRLQSSDSSSVGREDIDAVLKDIDAVPDLALLHLQWLQDDWDCPELSSQTPSGVGQQHCACCARQTQISSSTAPATRNGVETPVHLKMRSGKKSDKWDNTMRRRGDSLLDET